ncbi:hypothetical protein PCANC_00076 [Puccinia coronata f. sp. avenae]|uniref:Uncharacterized protein n=1 Tax=Puccinia coronata f. sp. avenae TaxID=200324 RepID=A0A2N5W8Q6_9BASI|nr:hypothetical protein PCANC_00076 [Puccinia coronata f. sp. avenae]
MAMDGEEGCSVARLDGFIESYYARRGARYPAEPTQFVDESYKNFVWRELCQLEPVRLGVLEPVAISNEVAEDDPARDPVSNISSIAQSSNDANPTKSLQLPTIASKAANKMTQRPNRLTKSTKNRNKSEVVSNAKNADANSPCLSIGQLRALETGKVQKNFQLPQSKDLKKATAPGKLAVNPSPSVWRELYPTLGTLSRDELITKYGLDEVGESKLKIAVDPMTCWKAVVGTDTRSPRLTPYVYQVLTIVAQGREAGATVIELGRKLKHDQKSLFHFVKVLTDLQLVVKFRAYQHKAWTNRVVHRRYLATSEWYKTSIQKDENHQAPSSSRTPVFDLDEFGSTRIGSPLDCSLSFSPVENQTMGNIIDSLTSDDPPKAVMSPINKEFLAVNENLVKTRMFTVLKRSPENTMVHADIIKAIGIATPTKDERRRLNRLIDAYIKRGLLERVAIVNLSGHTPCIRLTALGEESMNTTSSQPKPVTIATDDHELEEELNVLPITRSIGQTIHDLLENAGQEGITYKALCHKLNDIEGRTAEQILTRMEREQGPAHMSHLKVSSVLETSGREKRVRWFSSQGLKAKCQASGIMLAVDDEDAQITNAGRFIDINPSTLNQTFYENAAQFHGRSVPEPKGNWGKLVKKASRGSATGRRGKSSQRADRFDKKSSKQKDVEKDFIPEIHMANGPSRLNKSIPAKRTVPDSSHQAKPTKRPKRGLGSVPSSILSESPPSAAAKEHPHSANQLHPQPCTSALPQCSNEPSLPNFPPHSQGQTEPGTSTTLSVDTPGGLLKTRGARQNLTSLHREFHVLEAIKFAGGIVEKTNELSKAVRDLVDRADQDRVVSLMDSRTLNCALYGLEAKGEVKLTTVLVTDALGASCHRKIIYLSNIPLDGPEMKKWLEDLKVRFKTLDKATEARVNQHKDFASPVHRLPPRSASSTSPLPNALGVNDEALHAAFMNQWRCLSQLYGFVLGKAARAKILHVHILKSFNDSSQASSSSRLIIDSGHRIFSSGFLFQELPVGVFAKLVPIMAKSEEFENLRATPGAMETPMGNTPLAIRRLFQIGNQFSRVKVYQIVEVLYYLKLIVPLQKSSEVSEYYRIRENGEASYYSPCQMCTSVGLFCLVNEGYVHGFTQRSQTPPPVLAKWPLKNEQDGEHFWEEMKRASIPNPELPPTQNPVDSVEDEKMFNGPPKILQMLTDQSKWRDGIQLTPTQREYIVRLDKQTSSTYDLEKDDKKISNIAHVLVTVPEAVRQAIHTFREAAELARSKKAQKALNQPPKKRAKKKTPEIDAATIKSAQEKAAKVLSDKAKNALKQKEGDWNSIIKRFKTQSDITEIDAVVLKDLHTLFTTNNGGINANQLESELAAWLQRKKAAQHANSMEVDKGTELLVEIENTIGSYKRDLLPSLPSAKAKRIKMLKANPKPRRLKTKQVHRPRVFPDKPKKISAVAANAIRPQPDVEIGLRPSPCVIKPGQRTRIEWDEAHVEFLRDMIAIMRARAFATCAHVLPWPITLKMFTGARTHILRNRHAKLERDPKEKKYLDFLTEAWTQVYFDNRGKVPELPDPTPHVPASFDGALALDFLRSNIDKAYLRSQVSLPEKDEEQFSSHPLPRTYDQLRSNYKVRRMLPLRRVERWDEVHSFSNSVIREMNIITEPFTSPSLLGAGSKKERLVSHELLQACEAIKLLTSTPIKTYSEPIAAAVLSHYPDELLVRATDYLCLKGVIAVGGKLHYKKRLPGRSYCYTDRYLSNPDTRALQGPRHNSLTCSRSDSPANSSEEITWSLLASDTETASLLHAYSRGEVSLRITANSNRSKIWEISNFYRTRKLHDNSIENEVKVTFKECATQEIIPSPSRQPPQNQLDLVKQAVLQAGAAGITPPSLMENLSSQIPQETLRDCVRTLTTIEPRELHWACDEKTVILFSADYLPNWAQQVYVKSPNSQKNKDRDQAQDQSQAAAVIPKDPCYVIPRLWLDLSGNLVESLRQLSMDRVEHLIQTFPGLPYEELRRRTKLQLNPLELDDVLEELIRLGKVIEYEYGHDQIPKGKCHQVPSRWVRGLDRQRHFWIPATSNEMSSHICFSVYFTSSNHWKIYTKPRDLVWHIQTFD